MGYRTYLGIIEKEKIEDLRKCTTREELESVYKKYNWEYSKDDDGGEIYFYFPVYELDYEILYEFGKYADLGSDFNNSLVEIFDKNNPLHEFYEEYDFSVGGEKTFLCAIENYRCKIRDYFKNLLNNTNEFDLIEMAYMSEEERKEFHYNKLKAEAKNKFDTWGMACEEFGCFPYNKNPNQENLVSSWLYEYAIFELVRIYKTIDFDKYCVVYYGY